MKHPFRPLLLAAAVAAIVGCQPKESAEAEMTAAAAPEAQPAAQAQTSAEGAMASESLMTEAEKQSYSLGASVGYYLFSKLQQQTELGIEMDNSLILKGFQDGLEDNLQLSEEDIQAALQSLDAQIREKATAMAEQEAEKNREAGTAFLEENAKREGVQSTASGLQYEVINQGEGEQPLAEDIVTVHYRGTLTDGTEFDSSYARGEPASFPLNRVIPGWTEGLQLMKAGSKFKFYIPSELGYGEQAVGSIPPNSTLVFEVELLEIQRQETQEGSETDATDAAATE